MAFTLQPDRRSLLREKLAQALLGQGADFSPVQHPLQALARAASGLMGGYVSNKNAEADETRQKNYAAGLNAALMGAQGYDDIATRLSGSGNPDLAQLAPQFVVKGYDDKAKKDADERKAKAERELEEWKIKNDPSKRFLKLGNSAWDLQAPNGTRQPAFTAPFAPHAPPAPAEFERMLLAAGYKPGSPEYQAAAKQMAANKMGGGGPFAGSKNNKAMAWTYVNDPKNDPSSPEYASAFHVLNEPDLKQVADEQGNVRWAMVPPDLPPTVRRPAYMQQQAAQPPAAGQPGPQAAAQPAGAPPVAQQSPGVLADASPEDLQRIANDPTYPADPAMREEAKQRLAQAQTASSPASQPALGTPPGVKFIEPPRPKEMTGDQATSALYADRMRAAEQIIDKVGDAGLSLKDRVASSVPGGNYLVSNEYQQLDQAQRDFINATLRRESGAVISDQEFDNARRQYFPQPGDAPEVLVQKKRNRQVAVDGISRAAGSTYKPKAPATSSEPPPPPAGFTKRVQ